MRVLLAGVVLLSTGAFGQNAERSIEPYKYDWWIVGVWNRAESGCAKGPSVGFDDMGSYRAGGEVKGEYQLKTDGSLVLTPKGASAPIVWHIQDARQSTFTLIRADGESIPYVRCEDERMRRARTVAPEPKPKSD